jgi:hypothetical protein
MARVGLKKGGKAARSGEVSRKQPKPPSAPSTGRASMIRRRKFFRIYDQPAHDFPYDFLSEQDLYADGAWWGRGLFLLVHLGSDESCS